MSYIALESSKVVSFWGLRPSRGRVLYKDGFI